MSALALAMEMDEYMASLKRCIEQNTDADPHLLKCCIEFCIHGLVMMVENAKTMKSNKYTLKTFNENIDALEHIEDIPKLLEQMGYVASWLKTMTA